MNQPDSDNKDICAKCNSCVLDDHKAFSCDGCMKWHHIKCIDIPEAIYDLINNAEESAGFSWCCSKCRVIANDLDKGVSQFSGQLPKDTDNTFSIQSQIKKLNDTISDLSNKISALSDTSASFRDVTTQPSSFAPEKTWAQIVDGNIASTSGSAITMKKSNTFVKVIQNSVKSVFERLNVR